MSGFKALNIESDDESDVEVDDTKEIQIEDALKLYQNALRYHAQGSASFDDAAQAYQELFASEIFKYPESQTELRRIELYGALPEYDDLSEDVDGAAGVVASGLETVPSTLPQILHLSHKNYAQFKLEALTAGLDSFTLAHFLTDASSALEHFVDALDKDDSDLDLWRKTATVSELLDSRRVARFCLEAVLDGDDEGLNAVLAFPGLEDSLAGQHLQELVAALGDHLSLLQPTLSTSQRKAVSSFLKSQLDPYHGLVDHARHMERPSTGSEEASRHRKVLLKAPETWAELGDTILRQQIAERQSTGAQVITVHFDVASDGTHPLLPAQDALDSISMAMDVDTIPETMMPSQQLPATITQQFPGLDNGKPTTQPQIQSADRSMNSVFPSQDSSDAEVPETPTVILPSRKRSGETAGFNDAAEEGRTKSRRIRARESVPDSGETRQSLLDANIQWEFEQHLNEFQAADDWMYETIGGFFERVGVVGFDKIREVKAEVASVKSSSESRTIDHEGDRRHNPASHDMFHFLSNYSDSVAQHFLLGGDDTNFTQDTGPGSRSNPASGGAAASRTTSAHIAMPTHGLRPFLEAENAKWITLREIAVDFVKVMLHPGKPSSSESGMASYTAYSWSEELKTVIVRTLVNFDEPIYEHVFAAVEAHRTDPESEGDFDASDRAIGNFLELRGFLQNILELHLDIYCLIKQSNSGVDAETVTLQGDRLQRWAELAREAAYLWSNDLRSQREESLEYRFLWAMTFHIAAMVDISQEHVLACMRDLRTLLVDQNVAINLSNNAVMPEISVAALHREISKLTTKDFFDKVSDQEHKDPVSLIETIEPLVEALDARSGAISDGEDIDHQPSSVSPDLVQFIENSGVSVRLLLWQRLRDAYADIEYLPMIVACYFRMIRMVFGEMKGSATADKTTAERHMLLLNALRIIRSMTAKVLSSMQSSKDALDCIDAEGLRATITTFGEVLHILQVFNVFEDPIRLGQNQPPMLPDGLPVASFQTMSDAIHEMQLQIWIIQYALLKEAIAQNAALFPTPIEDRFDFLRTLHRNLGIRGMCGGLNRAFIRMLKDEFFQMTHVDSYDSEQSQVLYDLFGINCFLNPSYELIEHHCTHDAFLDRGVAMQIVDLLLAQADKLHIRDLIKHPLKDTIDKVHGTLARKKPTESILRNREIVRAFLRSSISPVDLYQCLKGQGNQLAVSPIPESDALLASKGWYFLMGHLALTKFRSTKRTGQTPTEDVDIAIAFFMQDLEYSTNRWETWFRLAQAYDTKVEESVVWSAEKLNSSMLEIVQLQRAAIHCYTMATALAYRSADLAFETSNKMTELYTEYAMRMYSSSREPFSMLPFAADDLEKFLSTRKGLGRGKVFEPLRVYTAWKLAKVLFQRAIVGNPEQWTLHYMLAKCLWKMHAAPEDVRGQDQPPTAQHVIASLIRAIELAPEKESRDTKREPVLEPHYKLVSIVHKMAIKSELTLEEARQALAHTRYAPMAMFPKDMEGWVPYALVVVRNLRAADKSNWHHRMIARAAQIVYDDADESSRRLGAMGAKHELTQQMFTKTMVQQVWRPEMERAGRHFVYTARYTRFFVQILEQLKDRASLEMLARRVRRRPHDVLEHTSVWQDICTAYLRLLRAHAALQEGLETSTFSNIPHDEFAARKEPLERWMQRQESGASAALDVLRDVSELKKVNQNLMKPGPIDDLIGDAYAFLFNSIGKQVWEEDKREKEEEEARRAPANPPKNPMMSLAHLMNVDGAGDSSPASTPAATGAPSSSAADAAPARRRLGVGRREIRTAAEACFQKSSAAAGGGGGKNAAGPPENVRVQVIIQSSRPGAAAGDSSAETSAPGSVNDDADDESELSELEEEGNAGEDEGEAEEEKEVVVPRRPIFPGLAAGSQVAERQMAESEGFETAEEGEGSGREEDVEMKDEPAEDKRDENVATVGGGPN